MTWVSALTSPTPPPLHPALVTSCIAAQLGSGLDNVKLCLECFESIEDPISENGVNVMKVNSIFPTADPGHGPSLELQRRVAGQGQRGVRLGAGEPRGRGQAAGGGRPLLLHRRQGRHGRGAVSGEDQSGGGGHRCRPGSHIWGLVSPGERSQYHQHHGDPVPRGGKKTGRNVGAW